MKVKLFIFALSFGLLSCGGADNQAAGTDAKEDNVEATTTQGEAAKTEEASIVGTWQMTNMDPGMDQSQLGEEEKAQMKAMIEEIAANTTYTFSEDGTTTLTSPDGEEKGTYSIEGDQLTAVEENGKTEVMTITELTANSLVLSMEIDGNKGSLSFKR